MIYNVPDPPRGSKITVEPDAYEIRLSWGGRWSTGRLVLSVVGAVVVAAVTVISQLFPQIFGASGIRPWMLNIAIGMGLFAFVLSVLRSYRALQPETLLLRLDGLTHTAGGKNSAAAPSHTAPLTFRVWNPPKRRKLPRAEVGEFGSGTRNGKEFVTVKVASGGTREIGWGLGEADREWLVSVLKRWKESPACQESPT